jgi:outer membrane protein assembly factor BamB
MVTAKSRLRCLPHFLFVGLLFSGSGCLENTPTQPLLADSIITVWRTPLLGERASYDGVAADDARFYALVGDDIAAYELATGLKLWQAPRPLYRPFNVVISGERLFTTSSAAVALDVATGAELWRFAPDTIAMAMSAVDDRAFYIGTSSRRVYALDVATGKPLFSVELLPDFRYGAYVDRLVVSGDTVYAALIDDLSPTGHLKRGIIVALDRYSGNEFWRYVNERAGESHDATYHTVAGRMLLVNDRRGGAIIGVDRFTGREVWRYTGPADRYGAWDDFKVVDGVAYVASGDTFVYALDPETGRIHWRHSMGGSANSSAVCGEYLFATAGSLHMLRRSDGQLKARLFVAWDGTVGDEWVRSRLLAHGDRVYFVGNKAVYSVRCG